LNPKEDLKTFSSVLAMVSVTSKELDKDCAALPILPYILHSRDLIEIVEQLLPAMRSLIT